MRGIENLYPPLKEKAEELLSLCDMFGIKIKITDTLRTKEEQDVLYAQGRTIAGSVVTNCRYPKSPHNWGLAFDFCRNDGLGAYNDFDGFFKKVGTLGKLIGLFWGGDFKGFEDKPHLEYKDLLPNNSTSRIESQYATPEQFLRGTNKTESKYQYKSGVHIVKIPVEKFRLLMWDKPKKTTTIKNYFNAGFFGVYAEKWNSFTLPVANLMADIGDLGEPSIKYLKEWGKAESGKVSCDTRRNVSTQFKDRLVSTLIVKNGKASISKVKELPAETEYAVSGVPVMIGGADASYSKDVAAQGWGSDSLYSTWHGFLAVDASGEYIWYLGWKSSTANLIKTSEAYKKFKGMGFCDVIKLDGGGSYVLDHNGKNVAVTMENRKINTVGLY